MANEKKKEPTVEEKRIESEATFQKQVAESSALGSAKEAALMARIESGADKRGEPASKEALAIAEAKDMKTLKELTKVA